MNQRFTSPKYNGEKEANTLHKKLKEHSTIFHISQCETTQVYPPFKGNSQRSRMSASFPSFELFLGVTDNKKFDTENVLPKTICHLL